MDFLRAEIERKKKQLQKSNVLGPQKTYFKRADLAAKQEEDYWRRHKKLKTDNDAGDEESQTQPSSSNTPGSSLLQFEDKSEKPSLPRKEVIRRLRERLEPIRLFGESDYEASQRLKKLEILEPEVNKGGRNELKDAFDKVDQEYINEVASAQGIAGAKTVDVKVKDAGATREDIEEMKANLGQGDHGKDSEILLKFYKLVLQLWGEELNQRDPLEKRSNKGKLASATHSQTVSYLKPLFIKLKNKNLDTQILVCMTEVVKYLLDRNYLRANDAYLEMAIGNAPWPIGVTMVGIHARTGREKIHDKNVAHVLNDETQRKYIQGLKRLMTKCQTFFPTDPSRSVNYERPKE